MIACGNISRCQGCSKGIMKARDGKPLPPPDELVQHVMFQNPKIGTYDAHNVYYYACMVCVRRITVSTY